MDTAGSGRGFDKFDLRQANQIQDKIRKKLFRISLLIIRHDEKLEFGT